MLVVLTERGVLTKMIEMVLEWSGRADVVRVNDGLRLLIEILLFCGTRSCREFVLAGLN